MVRRLVGYDRYDKPKQVKQLNQLYELYRQYVNLFLPVTKLVSKQYIKSRVVKVCDRPCTLYQRVLNATTVAETAKEQLRQQYAKLDMVTLKQQIDALNAQLIGSKL